MFAAGRRTSRGKRGLLQQLAGPVVPDPTAGIEWTGDNAKDAELELDAVQAGFRARNKQEMGRFVEATDSEYWVAVCFRTRGEKEAFLRAAGLAHLGDKYLDGAAVAAVLGVKE